MRRRGFMLSLCAVLLCVPTGCNPTGTVETAGRSATHWSLQQLNRVSHMAAVDGAQGLVSASAKGVAWLQSDAATADAEKVNAFLLNLLLNALPPGFGIGAEVLDNVLGDPVGRLLTAAEIQILTAFVKGVGEGAQDFIDGKSISDPTAKIKSHTRAVSRKWLVH